MTFYNRDIKLEGIKVKEEISSKEKKYVEGVVRKYEEREETKLEKLRKLDSKAKKGPSIFAYVFGSIGSLVLGFGMCLAMEIIFPGLMVVGILIGLVGIAMVSVNYSIYKNLLEKSKRKHADEILGLSKDLLNE